MLTIALLAAVTSFAHAFGLQDSTCGHDFGNASFNLRSLASPNGGAYRVRDSANNVGSRNYTYLFNVCKDTGSIPSQCDNGTYPDRITGGSPAWQLANFEVPVYDECHRLGISLGDGSGPSTNETEQWGLWSPANPSRGMSIKYVGGDRCPGTLGDRSLTIWIECQDDALNIPDEETVQETSDCHYEIFLRNTAGCPSECPVVRQPNGEDRLCNAHGICDFDTDKGRPKCFCYEGWEGDGCGSTVQPEKKGLSTEGAVLIVVCIVLVALIGLLYFIWQKVSTLRLDPAAYRSLAAGPEDAADVETGDGGDKGAIYDD